MSNPRPDDEIIEAKVETEEQEPPQGRPFAGRRIEKKPGNAGLWVVLVLLVIVGAGAWVFRREIVRIWDRDVAPKLGLEESTPPALPPETPVVEPVAQPPRSGRTAPELPNPEIPVFEKRTEPVAPPEPPPAPIPEVKPPPIEVKPGLAYSVFQRENVGEEGLKQFEFRVVVPATYEREDLLRMAQAIVASERRMGERHAIRILCFTDPAKTKPENLFATVDWGPGGDFLKAAEAVNVGSDKNTYSVRFAAR